MANASITPKAQTALPAPGGQFLVPCQWVKGGNACQRFSFFTLSLFQPAHTFLSNTVKSNKMSFNANLNPVEWSYFSHFPKEKMPGLRVVGVIGSVSVKKSQLSLVGVQTQACVSVKPAPFVSVCFYIIVF